MRLPMQAIPVARGMSRLRPASVIGMSSWGTCMISCLENKLSITNIGACASATSVTAIVSCILTIATTLDPAVVLADATYCALKCAF